MSSAAHRERLVKLETHREEHARRLEDLRERVDTIAFYLKAVVAIVSLIAYQIVGGPYAAALGEILGALH